MQRADCSAEWESLIETGSDGGSAKLATDSSRTDSHSRPPAPANTTAPAPDLKKERSVAKQSRSFEDLDVDTLISIPTAETGRPANKSNQQQTPARPPQRSTPVAQPARPSNVPQTTVAPEPVKQTPVELDAVPMDDDLLLNSVPLAVPSQFEQQLRPEGQRSTPRPIKRRGRNSLPSTGGAIGSIVIGAISSIYFFIVFIGALLAASAVFNAAQLAASSGRDLPPAAYGVMFGIGLAVLFQLTILAASIWLTISGIMEITRQKRSMTAIRFATVLSSIHLGFILLAFMLTILRAAAISNRGAGSGALLSGGSTTDPAESVVFAFLGLLVQIICPAAIIVLAIVRKNEVN